jgi:hypothetical protein
MRNEEKYNPNKEAKMQGKATLIRKHTFYNTNAHTSDTHNVDQRDTRTQQRTHICTQTRIRTHTHVQAHIKIHITTCKGGKSSGTLSGGNANGVWDPWD